MITKCFKCNSVDIVDVSGVLMCNNCGEILNSDTKKDITINIDKVLLPKDDSDDIDIYDDLDDIFEDDIFEEDTIEDDDFEDEELEFEGFHKDNTNVDDIMNQEGNWCYIDDIDGLDEDLSYEDFNGEFEEKYPGLLVAKGK